MVNLRKRGYLTEGVATQDSCQDPGGKKGSFGRANKEFYKGLVRQFVEAIPSSFIKSGEKAKVHVYNEGADIEGEADNFTWSINMHKEWMGSGAEVSAYVNAPHSRSLKLKMGMYDDPEELIEDVVDWLKARSKKK